MRFVLRTMMACVAIGVSPVFAAEAFPGQGDFLIQQEQQRQRQLEREQQEAKPGRAVLLPSSRSAEASPTTEGPCFAIQRIQVDGISEFPSDLIQSLYQPFEGQCLNATAIKALVGKITSLYLDAGFLTSSAYVPQQNLSGGTLRILVVEGVVEKIDLQGDNARRLATAFPKLTGKHLNLRDIEQGIDALTQSGAEAKVDFAPGEKVGGTRVIVRVKPRKAHMVSVEFDNNGQESTGKNRVSLTGTWDNAVGINDNLWLNLQKSVSGQADDYSQSVALTYAIPFGVWQFAVTHQGFDYHSLIPAEKPVVSDGESSVWSLDTKRLVMRDQTRLFHVGLKLKQQDIENRAHGERLDVSSRNYSAVELYFASQQLWSAHQLNNRLSIGRGLSSDQVYLGANTPDADFTKIALDTNWQSRWQIAGQPVTWRSDLSAQYSDSHLYSSEMISIGGKYSVRGFENGSQGNTGAYWRNSLSTIIRGDVDSFGYWQPYVAVDTGEVEHGPLQMGLALGANYSGQNLQIQLEVSKSLVTEELPSDTVQKDIGLNLSWRW